MGTAWPTCSRILRLWPSTTIRTVTVSCSWCWNAGSLGARAGARRTRQTGASAAHARRAPEAAAEARRGAIREDLIGAPPVMSASGGKADVACQGLSGPFLAKSCRATIQLAVSIAFASSPSVAKCKSGSVAELGGGVAPNPSSPCRRSIQHVV